MLVWPWPHRLTCNDYTVRLVWLALVVHATLLGTALALVRRAPWVTFAIAFFYAVTVNNPSCTILSNRRRRDLLHVAARLSREQDRQILWRLNAPRGEE